MKDYFDEYQFAEAYIKQQKRVLFSAETTIGVLQSEIAELKYLLTRKDKEIKNLNSRVAAKMKANLTMEDQFYKKLNKSLTEKIVKLTKENREYRDKFIYQLNNS